MFYDPPIMAHASNTLSVEQGLALARALYEQGKLVEAESIYRAILVRNPDHFGSLHAVGVIALKRNAPAGALEPLQKAVALVPDSAEAHNDLGMALASLGRPGDASAGAAATSAPLGQSSPVAETPNLFATVSRTPSATA
jgi:Flp pilus assembly protein TadD